MDPPRPPSFAGVRKIGVTLFKKHTRPVKPPSKSPSFSGIRKLCVSNTHPVPSKLPLDPPSREGVNPHLKKSDVQSGQAEKREEIVMADVVAASPVIENFKKEVESLKDMKERVEKQIGIAKDKGDNLIVGVEEWLNKAVDEISKAEEFIEQEAIAKKRCFEEIEHYGKMATKMTPPLLEHQVCGKEFVTCVAVDTPATGLSDVYENKHNLDDIVTIPVVDQKVRNSLSVVAKKKIGYMWYCSEYVQKFRQEAAKLKDMRERVQSLIDIAIREGDRHLPGVEYWVKEADTEISKADEFLQQEANAKKKLFKIGGNLETLYRNGKSATKMAPSLLQLRERGSAYETVSVETPADLEDLVTHNSALRNIIKSLEDESIQITGIYGLGGVGKTKLAMEVASRVMTNLFADVVFITVSQTINPEKIQKDLANATKRIMKGDKILIILDDVWEELNLEELCIPCGSNYMNCKILLTSRSEIVCKKMNAQSIFVDCWTTKEAWILFNKVVGEILYTDSNLKPVALKVVEECGGLPLLIQVIGRVLKDESIEVWKRALNQLQKHKPWEIDVSGIPSVLTSLRRSYEYLKSVEAQSCFLLCSLFHEAADIELEDLVRYVVGLELFHNLVSIEDARERVRNAVNMLTSSCLLLNVEDDKGCIKMHNVVRDVALLIGYEGKDKDKYKYLLKAGKDLTEWIPRDNKAKDLTDYKTNFDDFLGSYDSMISMLDEKVKDLLFGFNFYVLEKSPLKLVMFSTLKIYNSSNVVLIFWLGNDYNIYPLRTSYLMKCRIDL